MQGREQKIFFGRGILLCVELITYHRSFVYAPEASPFVQRCRKNGSRAFMLPFNSGFDAMA